MMPEYVGAPWSRWVAVWWGRLCSWFCLVLLRHLCRASYFTILQGNNLWLSDVGLIISDNRAETCLIITINDTSIGDLPLIITISDTCKNQPKRLDSDNTINLSSLITSLDLELDRERSRGRAGDSTLWWKGMCEESCVPAVVDSRTAALHFSRL